MAVFEIGYDGFMVVEADNLKQAEAQANKILSQANLPNDGSKGEWYLISSERID